MVAQTKTTTSRKKKGPVRKKKVASKKVAAKKKSNGAAGATRLPHRVSGLAGGEGFKGKAVVGKRQILMLDPKAVTIAGGFNPRIDMGDLAELGRSIKQNGVEQPITVYKDKGSYVVIDGERRVIAAIKVAVDKVPAQVVGQNDPTALLLRCVRANEGKTLYPVEEAFAYRRLITDSKGKITPKAIHVATGYPLARIKHRLDLVKAHPDVIQAVRDGKISVHLGVDISRGAETRAEQSRMAKRAAKSKAGRKQVAAELGKADLKTLFTKYQVDLANRLEKVLERLNKGKRKVDRISSVIGRLADTFNRSKNLRERAAFIAGGIYAITTVLGEATPGRKGPSKKKRTTKKKKKTRGKKK